MATTSKQNTFALSSIGIDIGKDVFHLVGFNPEGKVVLRKKIKRLALAGSCPMSAQPAGGRLDVGPKPYALAGSVKRSTRAQGDGVSAPWMIPDLDIYRSANTLIKQHARTRRGVSGISDAPLRDHLPN